MFATTTKKEEIWKKKFGKNLLKLIYQQNFKSAYDFWINTNIGDDISRSYLSYLVNGKRDPRAYLISKLAKALRVKVNDLFDI